MVAPADHYLRAVQCSSALPAATLACPSALCPLISVQALAEIGKSQAVNGIPLSVNSAAPGTEGSKDTAPAPEPHLAEVHLEGGALG